MGFAARTVNVHYGKEGGGGSARGRGLTGRHDRLLAQGTADGQASSSNLRAAALRQALKELAGFYQIRGVKALGEPALDRCEQVMGVASAALVAP